jgi:hypothetical protein
LAIVKLAETKTSLLAAIEIALSLCGRNSDESDSEMQSLSELGFCILKCRELDGRGAASSSCIFLFFRADTTIHRQITIATMNTNRIGAVTISAAT